MDRIWGEREKGATELSTSVLGGRPDGAIAVIIRGDALDAHLVSDSALTWRKVPNRKSISYTLSRVPRALPLKALLTAESERADKHLSCALEITSRIGCQAQAFVVQAREAGPAIVDEVKDHCCALLMLGHLLQDKIGHQGVEKTVAYVLANAHCRAWLVQDRQISTATHR